MFQRQRDNVEKVDFNEVKSIIFKTLASNDQVSANCADFLAKKIYLITDNTQAPQAECQLLRATGKELIGWF